MGRFSTHKGRDFPSGSASIVRVKPSQSSLENGGWILENALNCNYLSIL